MPTPSHKRRTKRVPTPDRRRALEYFHPIYALVIASLILAVALGLMADGGLAAEPQMPEDFQGRWCGSLKSHLNYDPDWCPEPDVETEITPTGLNSPAISTSCVARQITTFDVCPWGMIYKDKKKAQALREHQINPWGPGYYIVFQCTNASKRSETIRTDWVMEKGNIRVNVPRDYRCPWDRRGARLH
jgi:hypothetical protein